jgi:hypothetical protein
MRGRERDEVCFYSESTPSSMLIGSFRRSTFTKITWIKKAGCRAFDRHVAFFIIITVPSMLLVVDLPGTGAQVA